MFGCAGLEQVDNAPPRYSHGSEASKRTRTVIGTLCSEDGIESSVLGIRARFCGVPRPVHLVVEITTIVARDEPWRAPNEASLIAMQCIPRGDGGGVVLVPPSPSRCFLAWRGCSAPFSPRVLALDPKPRSAQPTACGHSSNRMNRSMALLIARLTRVEVLNPLAIKQNHRHVPQEGVQPPTPM